jgi:hypothetical protein
MHLRIRVATSVALLALTVAACGSTASSPAASGAASAAPSASAPATSAPAQSTAPDASAPVPSASAVASAAPTPTASPTPEQQAIMDVLPKKVKDQALQALTTDTAAYIASDPTGAAPIVAFFKTLGIDPAKVILVGDVAPQGTTPASPFVIAAYRFPGIDPDKVKTEFIKFYISQKDGSTSEEQTIGGRKVTALLPPTGQILPPIYLLFQGDTVYEVGSTDQDFAAEALKALP